jgi:integrase
MNTALAFPVPETPLDKWDFYVVGNSHFTDNVWDLTPLFHNKRAGVFSMGRLNFQLLQDFPDIVEPIKRYCYIRLGQVKPRSVALEYTGLAGKLIPFLNAYKLTSLEQIDSYHFMEFNIWLKRFYLKSDKSITGLARISNTLLQVINIGQSMDFPSLSNEAIVLETSIWDWWGTNKQGRETRQSGPEDRSIPLSLWKQILQKAWEEPNIIEYIQGGQSKGLFRVNNAKFGILIQAYTGLRISEVLYLKISCVEKDNKDKYWLNTEIEKTEGEATPHKILIPETIYNLILEMDALTEPLRQEAAEKNYLFYVLSQKRKKGALISGPQRYKPTPVESGKWNKDVLKLFLERNNLPTSFKNSQNHTIDMSSHCFRHTFARIAVAEKNVNPSVIQTHFKHLSIEMTMHYVNLTKTDLKKSYLQGMIEADNIYTQGKEGVEFKKKISDVKTVDDLNEAVDGISKLFGINPLPFGLCLYDFKRGHCPHLGVQSCYMANCSDFVTNETFLPTFENEISILSQHVHQCQKTGQVVEEKKAKYHLQKLYNIVAKIEKGD